MKIVYVNWKCFGGQDLVAALLRLGHEVSAVELSDDAQVKVDDEFVDRLCRMIRNSMAELVISFNYYPSISVACMRTGCRYFAWIYDSPYIKAYDATVSNNVNYVGSFDSYMVEELCGKGVDTMHYVPLAVDADRIKKTIANAGMNGSADKYKSQIAFVGSLYNDKNKFYERLFSAGRDMELAGYLDAVIEAQRKVYGCNFTDECISGETLDKIREFMPYNVPEGSYLDERKVYADYYLGPRIAFLDRKDMLESLGRYFETACYTGTEYKLAGVTSRGRVDYYDEMPIVFNNTKINLNISLRSIRTGIPLRAMDVMGAGGFLLTNYQQDMFRHFEAGVHFEYYTSVDEAVDKAAYYLEHDDERSRIATAALEEMEKNHTFDVRLAQVLSDCM